MEVSQALCPWSKRRAKEFGSCQDHGPTVVAATDRGASVTIASLSPFGCVVEKAAVVA